MKSTVVPASGTSPAPNASARERTSDSGSRSRQATNASLASSAASMAHPSFLVHTMAPAARPASTSGPRVPGLFALSRSRALAARK
ncbi:MAG: hypothetical protein AB2L07_01940 [Thermoanaerobaculaceae bacterium]